MANAGSTLSQLREVEREARRNLIIDAAMHLFAERPFNQVGIRDIAAQAGLSPASIYRYFNDRDELFLEAFFRESASMELIIRDLLDDAANLSIERTATTYLDYLLDHDAFFQMMTHFMIQGGMGPEVLEKFNEAERRLLRSFDRIFVEIGIKGVDGNVRVVSHAFFSALNGILITFRNYPGRDTKDVRRHMHRLAAIISEAFRQLAR